MTARTQSEAKTPSRHPAARIWLVLIVFSIFYFTDVLIRQSEKYFWYDEILTVLVCRLDLSMLPAVMYTGFDYSPPFFHLVTKASQAVLGAGPLGTRAPAIVGFWVMCLCLFRFVNQRLGLAAGVIAMLFPVFTETFFYAYEARPYGLVLAFSGTALVSWQIWREGKHPSRWLFAFSASLLCAFLLHTFAILIAVPFAVAEVYSSFRTYSLRRRFWLALVLPALLAGLSYIPVLRAYHAVVSGTSYANFAPHDWGQIPRFYAALLAPCIVLVVLAFAITATASLWSGSDSQTPSPRLSTEEVIVAIGFSVLPALGIFISKTTHSVVFPRYFGPALIGLSLLLAITLDASRVRRVGVPVFAWVLAFTFMGQLAGVFRNHYHWQIPSPIPEPVLRSTQNITLGGPLFHYLPLLTSVDAGSPIAVTHPLDFLYLVYYAPDLRRRLYYATNDPRDTALHVFTGFRPISPIPYNASFHLQDFLRLAPHVYVFGYDTTAGVKPLLDSGAQVRLLNTPEHHYVADVLTPRDHIGN